MLTSLTRATVPVGLTTQQTAQTFSALPRLAIVKTAPSSTASMLPTSSRPISPPFNSSIPLPVRRKVSPSTSVSAPEADTRTTASVARHIERIRNSRQPVKPTVSRSKPLPTPRAPKSAGSGTASPPLRRTIQDTKVPLTRTKDLEKPKAPLKSCIRKPRNLALDIGRLVSKTFGRSKKVHFQHLDRTEAEIRYYQVPEGSAPTFIRDEFPTSNMPHTPGKVVNTMKSGGRRFSTRYDGVYKPPTRTGMLDPLADKCPYCRSISNNPGDWSYKPGLDWEDQSYMWIGSALYTRCDEHGVKDPNERQFDWESDTF